MAAVHGGQRLAPKTRGSVELGLGLEGGVGFLLIEGREEGRAEKEHRADWWGFLRQGC